ncbi:MAG: TRAP transporter large permease [Pseudorhodoplanes sp.]|uniref:TRAP transporter large permease n=1 Tax=Pseudorhodoplanes sp. TaxID=1934341 RepID=UPI003D149EDC
MDGLTLALVAFAAMFGLIALRMPIGLAMLVVGAAGYAELTSVIVLFNHMKVNVYHQFANYTLSVIPLFILMGAFAERSGIARLIFEAAERGLKRFKGGLPISVIVACTAFGSISGSSVATTATFGRAVLPELARARCDAGLATATIAVGGTLGILIPPSVILVLYGIIVEQNIAKLFQAALIPGLLATLFYCITISILVRRNPSLIPSEPSSASMPVQAAHRFQRIAGILVVCAAVAAWLLALIGVGLLSFFIILALFAIFVPPILIPVLGIGVIVLGGIYGGVFTPTEGAAVGAAAMLVTGLLQRKLGMKDIAIALVRTGHTTGMIFLILLGAEMFGSFLALTRMPMLVAQAINEANLSPIMVLVAILSIYLVLGAVMDELAMLLLTLPLFAPIILALDFGMPRDDVGIWFGILVLVVCGVGLIAPPIGMNVFVINKVADGVPITTTYRGIMPFVAADVIRLVILVAFPALSLWMVHALN